MKARPLVRSLWARRLPGGCPTVSGVVVTFSQALAWNRRTCRLDSDGQSKWVCWAPGRKRENAKGGTPRDGEYRGVAQGRTGP
jgi:hypothetical protein